jgi:hypothetical protein
MTKIINKKQKSSSRHWKNFVDKDYLGSHNLEKDEEMLLTISKFVGEEEVNTVDGKKVKQVIYFKEDVPKMIMNITNGNIISNLYGSRPDAWTGKQIQVFAASVKAFGKTQDALRIRDFIPKITVDVEKYRTELETCKTLEELKKKWQTLPVSINSDPNLIKIKDEIKIKLTK